MTLVCSTRLKPRSMARLRTAWRTLTTSSPERTGNVAGSIDMTAFVTPAQDVGQQGEASVDVHCGADTRQRQAELDQGDGDRGLHAHDHGLGIEDARHG